MLRYVLVLELAFMAISAVTLINSGASIGQRVSEAKQQIIAGAAHDELLGPVFFRTFIVRSFGPVF